MGVLYRFVKCSNLASFSPEELALLIAGDHKVDIEDWRRETVYEGYTIESPVVLWFWETVKSFPEGMIRKLLQFATGSSHIPIEGFKGLQGTSGTSAFTIARLVLTQVLDVYFSYSFIASVTFFHFNSEDFTFLYFLRTTSEPAILVTILLHILASIELISQNMTRNKSCNRNSSWQYKKRKVSPLYNYFNELLKATNVKIGRYPIKNW